jgi:hypothetical protein
MRNSKIFIPPFHLKLALRNPCRSIGAVRIFAAPEPKTFSKPHAVALENRKRKEARRRILTVRKFTP